MQSALCWHLQLNAAHLRLLDREAISGHSQAEDR